MFTHIVTQLSGRVMDLCGQALAWLKALLWKLAKLSPVNFIRIYQNVANLHLLNNLRVQTGLSTNRLIVNLITVEQSISLGLSSVKQTLTQIGSQLLTIVRQILQRVRQVLQQIKDKLVASIKLVQLRLSEIGCVQTLMALPLIQIGTKLRGLVSPLLQRVMQVVKAKR